MPHGDELTPDKAPWILIGGSYAGALTSWTMVKYVLRPSSNKCHLIGFIKKNSKPGVFFTGYASSGVVQATLYVNPLFFKLLY